jgi:HemY protein
MKRNILSIAAFFALASLSAVGLFEVLSQARMNTVLALLPDVPPLNRRNQVLRDRISDADKTLREKLAKDGVDQIFGHAVGDMGRLYQANQFYDQALSCYRLALDYDRQSAQWYYLSASIHQQRGETASMIGFLEQTLRLSANYSPAVLKLADTYFKTGDRIKAKVYYEQRLDLEDGDPYALMGLARIAMERNQWDAAEMHLQKAVRSNMEFGDAHRLLAEVYEHNGRFEEMEISLARAADCIRFRPATDPWIDELEDLCYDPEQLLVLGSMALTELDMETALGKHFSRALKIDPDNPMVHLAVGKAWFMAGDWSKAYKYLKQTIALDSDSGEAYFHLGLIHQHSGDLTTAEAMMLKALVYQPNNANVLNNLGVIQLEQSRYLEAAESFEKALDIYPEHVNASYNLGMALWASGRSPAAIVQLRKVLDIKPDWPMAANTLAWILATDQHENIRNGEDAVKWAHVALRGENRNNPEYLDTLAAAYAENGKFEDAESTIQQALIILGGYGDTTLRQAMEERLQFYRSGRPYREN